MIIALPLMMMNMFMEVIYVMMKEIGIIQHALNLIVILDITTIKPKENV